MNEENNKMSVYEIPVEKISPNPYQPRREFNELNLSSLAESIRQYGVMQPIVVTKKTDGDFELISGERRLRASKIAGKKTIPAVVRDYEHSNEEKFELAIIENLQREDLNPIDKAKSFKKLVEEFNLTHSEIAQKMGKSREYVSNSLRILMLPDNILDSMVTEEISEGHARPLLMLKDRPFEQGELFKKIIQNKLTVRAAEKIARSVAVEKVRKPDNEVDSDLKKMETKLAEKLGTKVSIDKKISGEGGKLTIEYFSKEDLEKIINLVKGGELSSAPILESEDKNEKSSNFAIEKFENNFTSQKTGEESLISELQSSGQTQTLSEKKPVVFGEEINSLDKLKKEKEDSKKNIDELLNKEEKVEGIDGFSITSFDKNIHIESIENKNSLEGIEEKKQEENFNLNNGINVVEESGTVASAEVVPEKLYNDTFSNFGEINNFNLIEKKEREEIPLQQTREQVQKDINTSKNNIVENENIGRENKDGDEFSKLSPQPQLEKSEAQKRIDAILAGNSTVNKEYGIKENLVEKNKEEHFNSEGNIIEKEEGGIEESSIYKRFLESKRRIEEEKNNMYEEENIDNKKNENNGQNSFGKLSENSSEFIFSDKGIDSEKKSEMTDESSIAMNQINDNTKKKEQIDAIFNGDDFIPKREIEDNDEEDKDDLANKSKDGYNFSI